MSWQSLLNPDIQEFVHTHEKDDVAALALKTPPTADWDYKLILDQIKSRQKAQRKIPLWLTHHKNIIFPPPDLLEQASSAATARYKAGLIQGKTFVDLTGGCGVDTCAFTEHFTSGYCIEKDKSAADLLAHNLPLLSPTPVEVINTSAENFIKTMPPLDVALIDPQRRDSNQKGKYRFEDCTPNILSLLPGLLEKTQTALIKTSPMLDITQGIAALESTGAAVQEVHCPQWQGECKELLFITSQNTKTPPTITAVTLNDEGKTLSKLAFTQKEEITGKAPLSEPLTYLYEPGPAFQKSGGFNTIAQKYAVHKLAPQTHLYTSNNLINDFPGRSFEIVRQYPVKAEKIPLKQAHITVRNFPMSTPNLRKKLKIKDGGQDYLFACTLANGTKTMLHARKI